MNPDSSNFITDELNERQSHRCGFVNIIGKPNAGKSTLINELVGENVAIVTNKAQTTRHRILGIVSGDDFQIVYSDTPGIITPKYELQKRMMRSANSAFHDADLFLWVMDATDEADVDLDLNRKLTKTGVKTILLLNKTDLLGGESVMQERMQELQQKVCVDTIIPISALKKFNTKKVSDYVLENLPEHPAYFPKDVFTDKPERFVVEEMIREKIFLNYHEEIPYCVSVKVDSFKESDRLIKISTVISVERQSQKAIIIGKDATALKKISTLARLDMENFFNKKIFLEQYVRVEENWRSRGAMLDQFGYV